MSDSEFARLARKTRRAVSPPKDVNLPDENPARMRQRSAERRSQAIDSLKKLAVPAGDVSRSILKGKKR